MACYNKTGEVVQLRRAVYLFLAVFLVQVAGLRAFCAPSPGRPGNCCHDCGKTHPQPSSSLPDCCVSSIFNLQGSITETPNSFRSERMTAQLGTASIAAVPARNATPRRERALPSVSPPLSPLSQSCALLI